MVHSRCWAPPAGQAPPRPAAAAAAASPLSALPPSSGALHALHHPPSAAVPHWSGRAAAYRSAGVANHRGAAVVSLATAQDTRSTTLQQAPQQQLETDAVKRRKVQRLERLLQRLTSLPPEGTGPGWLQANARPDPLYSRPFSPAGPLVGPAQPLPLRAAPLSLPAVELRVASGAGPASLHALSVANAVLAKQQSAARNGQASPDARRPRGSFAPKAIDHPAGGSRAALTNLWDTAQRWPLAGGQAQQQRQQSGAGAGPGPSSLHLQAIERARAAAAGRRAPAAGSMPAGSRAGSATHVHQPTPPTPPPTVRSALGKQATAPASAPAKLPRAMRPWERLQQQQQQRAGSALSATRRRVRGRTRPKPRVMETGMRAKLLQLLAGAAARAQQRSAQATAAAVDAEEAPAAAAELVKADVEQPALASGAVLPGAKVLPAQPPPAPTSSVHPGSAAADWDAATVAEAAEEEEEAHEEAAAEAQKPTPVAQRPAGGLAAARQALLRGPAWPRLAAQVVLHPRPAPRVVRSPLAGGRAAPPQEAQQPAAAAAAAAAAHGTRPRAAAAAPSAASKDDDVAGPAPRAPAPLPLLQMEQGYPAVSAEGAMMEAAPHADGALLGVRAAPTSGAPAEAAAAAAGAPPLPVTALRRAQQPQLLAAPLLPPPLAPPTPTPAEAAPSPTFRPHPSDPHRLARPSELTTALLSAGSWVQVAQLVHRWPLAINHMSLTCAFKRLAKCCSPQMLCSSRSDSGALLSMLQHLCFQVEQHLPTMRPREMSEVLWSMARLGYYPPPHVLEALVAAFLDVLPAANGLDLSNATWALAAMGRPLEQAELGAVWERMRACLLPSDRDSVRSLIVVLNCCTRMGCCMGREQLRWLEGVLLQLAPRLSGQDVANALSSLARLSVTSAAAAAAAAAAPLTATAASSPSAEAAAPGAGAASAASSAVGASAGAAPAAVAAGCGDGGVSRTNGSSPGPPAWRPAQDTMRALVMRVHGVMPTISGDEAAWTLYAVARLGFRIPTTILSAALRRAVSQRASSSTPAVALLLWAAGRLRARPPGWWRQTMLAECCRRLPHMAPAYASASLHGLVQLRAVEEPAHAEALLACLAPHVPCFSSHELASAAWALAWLPRDCVPPRGAPFWAALGARCTELGGVGAFSPQGLANLLWAAAALADAPPPPTVLHMPKTCEQKRGAEECGGAAAAAAAAAAGGGAAGSSSGEWGAPDAGAAAAAARAAAAADLAAALLGNARGRSELAAALAAALPRFNGTELSMAVWALARLRCRPATRWLDAAAARGAKLLRSLPTHGLTALVHAITWFPDYVVSPKVLAAMEDEVLARNACVNPTVRRGLLARVVFMHAARRRAVRAAAHARLMRRLTHDAHARRVEAQRAQRTRERQWGLRQAGRGLFTAEARKAARAQRIAQQQAAGQARGAAVRVERGTAAGEAGGSGLAGGTEAQTPLAKQGRGHEQQQRTGPGGAKRKGAGQVAGRGEQLALSGKEGAPGSSGAAAPAKTAATKAA